MTKRRKKPNLLWQARAQQTQWAQQTQRQLSRSTVRRGARNAAHELDRAGGRKSIEMAYARTATVIEMMNSNLHITVYFGIFG